MKIAIVGGTGLSSLENLEIIRSETLNTPFGKPSADLTIGEINNKEVIFLARHGHTHNIPPHKVNYRANIWVLNEVGVDAIIAVNAVGGIRDDMIPGSLVIPDQIVDYTTSRINTFFEDDLADVAHIDFSYPYSETIRTIIFASAQKKKIQLINNAVYAATEGPRLETAAEIQRLKRDGCDIVGMTGMPEAALARELEIDYASICVNANWAAGLSDELITMDVIEKNIYDGMEKVRQLIVQILLD